MMLIMMEITSRRRIGAKNGALSKLAACSRRRSRLALHIGGLQEKLNVAFFVRHKLLQFISPVRNVRFISRFPHTDAGKASTMSPLNGIQQFFFFKEVERHYCCIIMSIGHSGRFVVTFVRRQ